MKKKKYKSCGVDIDCITEPGSDFSIIQKGGIGGHDMQEKNI